MATGGAKVQGPGGLGQWDTGTANRDIRSVLNPSSRTSSGGGSAVGGNVVTPQMVAQNEKRYPPKYDPNFGKQPKRAKPRSKVRAKVRSTGRGSAKAR